jgi:nucleotide-binding universal stress UspA family protein
MATGRGFKVVVATDGSADGRAAVAMACIFPWPAGAEARGVVARFYPTVAAELSAPGWAAVAKGFDEVAVSAQRVLRGRWPDAEVAVRDRPPVQAILTEARGASVIVLGTRGHSALGRLVLGSVSRAVARSAACSTLIVRSQPRQVTRFLVGVDGSANAQRAVAFMARLRPPRGGRVTLVRVVEPVRVPSLALMPGSVRGVLNQELAEVRDEQTRRVQRELMAATVVLKRARWRVRPVLRQGSPVPELIAASRAAGAHVVVLGARGTGGIKRLLLGSVAEGVLSSSQAPILLVR